MKKEKSCGAIIINNENKVLLIKHVQGHWSFPKGHIENNETEKETALREVKEETNLDIEIDEKIRIKTTYSPEKGVIKDVIYFKGYNPKGIIKVQETEVITYKWIKINDINNYLTFDGDKKLFKDFLRKINYNRSSI